MSLAHVELGLKCPVCDGTGEIPWLHSRRWKDLYERHQRMVVLEAQGLSNKKIAEVVGLHETTVTHHLNGYCQCLANGQ